MPTRGNFATTPHLLSCSPYWNRPSYQTLIHNTWDIVVIMLGTNDAKDGVDGGPSNWGCGVGPNVTVASCQYAQDYLAFLDVVKGLGPNGASPAIYVMVPAPLMAHGAIGANQASVQREGCRCRYGRWHPPSRISPP